MSLLRVFVNLYVLIAAVQALASNSALYTQKRLNLRLFGFMDAINKAMANENLGPAQNAGLSKEPETMEVEFVGVKNVKVKAYAGQKVSMVANAARVPIKYNCKAGDCGTCEVNLDGKIVKACQAVLPYKKSCKIQPLK